MNPPGTVGYLRVRVIGHDDRAPMGPRDILEVVGPDGKPAHGTWIYEDPAAIVTAAQAEEAIRRKLARGDV